MKKHNYQNNFIVIQGWMIERLDLTGNELLAYAFIYGLTQWSCYEDRRHEYCEFSYEFLGKLLHISKQATIKLIRRLEEKGYIFKSGGYMCTDDQRNRNCYKIIAYSSEQSLLVSGQLSLLPLDKKEEYINTLTNNIFTNACVKSLEDKNIKDLNKHELRALREQYKERLDLIELAMKEQAEDRELQNTITIAKAKWIYED